MQRAIGTVQTCPFRQGRSPCYTRYTMSTTIPPRPDQPTQAAQSSPAPQRVTVAQALRIAREQKASDLHILGNTYLRLRVSRRVTAVPYIVARDDVSAYVAGLRERDPAADAKMKRLGAFDIRDTDEQGGALRLHVYQDGSGLRLAMRLLGNKPPVFADLGLPRIIESFVDKASGLLLIAGPQGTGKTHLQHALVDTINRQGGRSVVVIEHPKEFQHEPAAGSIIIQQEPGPASHTPSYAQGVVSAMNADSNVIVIGQITSADEARAALDAAVKGSLVIATIHARNAVQSIESLVSWFPPDDVERVRLQIAQSFIAAVSLRLLPHVGSGVQPVAEVLVTDEVVTRSIASGTTDKIRSHHMPQQRAHGNITLEAAMNEQIQARRVRASDARKEAVFPDEVREG